MNEVVNYRPRYGARSSDVEEASVRTFCTVDFYFVIYLFFGLVLLVLINLTLLRSHSLYRPLTCTLSISHAHTHTHTLSYVLSISHTLTHSLYLSLSHTHTLSISVSISLPQEDHSVATQAMSYNWPAALRIQLNGLNKK